MQYFQSLPAKITSKTMVRSKHSLTRSLKMIKVSGLQGGCVWVYGRSYYTSTVLYTIYDRTLNL